MSAISAVQLEESPEVFTRLAADFFGRYSSQLANLPCRLDDKRRFVALAAVWHRREIWRIRLNEDAVERSHRRGFANILRLGIGDVAGKRQHEAEIERLARVLDRAGEAVQHAAEPTRGPVFADQA